MAVNSDTRILALKTRELSSYKKRKLTYYKMKEDNQKRLYTV